jgi:hypothetical protein
MKSMFNKMAGRALVTVGVMALFAAGAAYFAPASVATMATHGKVGMIKSLANLAGNNIVPLALAGGTATAMGASMNHSEKQPAPATA